MYFDFIDVKNNNRNMQKIHYCIKNFPFDILIDTTEKKKQQKQYRLL